MEKYYDCVTCVYKDNSIFSAPCADCRYQDGARMTGYLANTPVSKKELSYWDNVCAINDRQEAKGKEKYGEILEDNTTLSREQRIEHLEEELIDALKYAEHLKKTFADNLTANDYQRMAMRTNSTYADNYAKMRNAAYGMNGEAGEVIDLLKKHEFQGHELDTDKIIDETSDVLWYCALMAEACDTTLENIMLHNVDKLKKRYPDGFDKARSINRAESVENNG